MSSVKYIWRHIIMRKEQHHGVNDPSEVCEACRLTLTGARKWKGVVTGHHLTLTDFMKSLDRRCWICVALMAQLSDTQCEALAQVSLEWHTPNHELGHYTWVVVNDTTDGAIIGPKGTFAFHLMFTSDVVERLQDVGRQTKSIVLYPAVYLWAQPSTGVDQKMLATPVGSSTGDDQAWETAKRWLQNCDSQHRTCNRSYSIQGYPTRLLDLNDPILTSNNIRLIETAETHVEGSYVTLSHCWGTENVMTLRNDNFEDCKDGIAIEKLNKTFQHAIQITRRMEIRYIWIDSMCIIQEDPSLVDWAVESVKMAQYYANAYCNISATASYSGREGLFRSHDIESLQHRKYEMTAILGRVRGLYNIFDVSSLDRQLHEAPLHRRAWVLQERLLAKRVLHFCQNQLMWECREHTASEMYPHGLPDITPLRQRSHFKDLNTVSPSNQAHFKIQDGLEMGYQLWGRITREYSRCFLTYPRDKSNAIQGLTDLFSFSLGDDCVYGCWKKRITQQLLWRPHEILYPPTNMLYLEPRKYDIPSWSWLSSDCPLKTPDPPGSSTIEQENILCNVLKFAPKANERSELSSDQVIILKCILQQATLELSQHGLLKIRLLGETSSHINSATTIWLDGLVNELTQSGDRMHLFVVPMRRCAKKRRAHRKISLSLECLLLRFVGAQQYKRVGIMEAEDIEAIDAVIDPDLNASTISSHDYDATTGMHIIDLI